MAIISTAALGKTALNFLQIAWKPLALMIGGIILAHIIYYGPKIDNKNLKLELQKQEVFRMESIIKDQNEKIQKASEQSRREFDTILEDLRKNLSDRNRVSEETLQRILDSATPESCLEINTFLLEQIGNLQWGAENE